MLSARPRAEIVAQVAQLSIFPETSSPTCKKSLEKVEKELSCVTCITTEAEGEAF